MLLTLPFASKQLPDGRKLFRRKRGYTFTLNANGNTVYSINVPYNICKINEAEILYTPEGLTLDLAIKDTEAGTYSGVSNSVLNQYGIGIVIAKDFYKDTSPYDADVYLGMILEFTIHNPTSVTKTVGINIVFHEII